jgi:hypothetical protein
MLSGADAKTSAQFYCPQKLRVHATMVEVGRLKEPTNEKRSAENTQVIGSDDCVSSAVLE